MKQEYKHEEELTELEVEFIDGAQEWFNDYFASQDTFVEAVFPEIDHDTLVQMMNNAEAHVRIRKELQ